MPIAVDAVQNYDPITLVVGAAVGLVAAVVVAVLALFRRAVTAARALGRLPWTAFADGFRSVFGVAFAPDLLPRRRGRTWLSTMDELARCYAEMGPPPGGSR